MFSVAGWSLPASGPASQTADAAAAKKKMKRGKTKKNYATGSNSVDVTHEVAAKIKERERAARIAAEKEERRANPDAAVVVNAENVDKLWRKVVEGAGAEDRPKKRKRGGSTGKKKREGAEGNLGEGEGEEEEEEEEEEGAPLMKKKTLKEKRREKKAVAAAAKPKPTTTTTTTTAPVETLSKLTPLQQKMRAKLTSARFRHINETLYTTPSTDSFELFSKQPEMYTEYHLGFRQQVSVWPSNPVDTFISALRSRSNIKFSKGYSHTLNSTAVLPLPRDRDSGICTVADLGCGDAKIAATLNHGRGQKLKIKVLSFDLQASTPDVTVADVANLPLEKESADVVIFCLALMGTNFLDFVDEAYRILKWRGELWVAEIKSRFNRKVEGNANAVGRKKGEKDAEAGDEPEMEGGEKRGVPRVYKNFVDALARRGFMLKGSVDDDNKMFVRMEFVKQPEAGEGGDEGDEMEGRAAQGARQGGNGARGHGRGGKQIEKKTKFIEDELKEDQIMKPCVYKLR